MSTSAKTLCVKSPQQVRSNAALASHTLIPLRKTPQGNQGEGFQSAPNPSFKPDEQPMWSVAPGGPYWPLAGGVWSDVFCHDFEFLSFLTYLSFIYSVVLFVHSCSNSAVMSDLATPTCCLPFRRQSYLTCYLTCSHSPITCSRSLVSSPVHTPVQFLYLLVPFILI